MQSKVPFQLWLDRPDRVLLDRLAKHLRVSRAEAVRAAVRRWAREVSGEQDDLLGLIGSVDRPGVPTDLSTRHDEYAVRGYPVPRVADPRDEGGAER